jgi:hypothetical protein
MNLKPNPQNRMLCRLCEKLGQVLLGQRLSTSTFSFGSLPWSPSTPIAVRVYFRAACWKRRFHIKETAVSPDEVMSALRRYLENTGDTERAAALKMGVNRHTLCRWLSDEQSPKKGKMALAAFFLRQAGYL